MAEWLEDHYNALFTADNDCINDIFLINPDPGVDPLGCAGEIYCERFSAMCYDWARDLTEVPYDNMSDNDSCAAAWAALLADMTTACTGLTPCTCAYDGYAFLTGTYFPTTAPTFGDHGFDLPAD